MQRFGFYTHLGVTSAETAPYLTAHSEAEDRQKRAVIKVLIDQNNLEGLQQVDIKLNELTAHIGLEPTIFDHASDKGVETAERQAILNYFYNDIVLPCYRNSKGDIDYSILQEYTHYNLLHYALLCRQNSEVIGNLLEHIDPRQHATDAGNPGMYPTPALLAARIGYTDALRHHPELITDVTDTQDLFHRSIRYGKVAFVEYLLEKGIAKVNTDEAFPTQETAAHIAAHASRHFASGMLALLKRYGADFTKQTADGWTPLHSAVYSHSIEGVAFLCGEGVPLDIPNKKGDTALDMAARWGSKSDIAKYLESQVATSKRDLEPPSLKS